MPVEAMKVETSFVLPLYAVIGQYENGSNFLRHVALAREPMAVTRRSPRVPVWQMGPPLVVGLQSRNVGDSTDTLDGVDVVGYVELSSEEIEGIQTWLADVDTERRPLNKWQQYAACPHFFWKLDEAGMRLYRRFSCAGLVVESYLSVDIRLIETDSLSPVDLGTLARVYGENVANRQLREWLKIGLDGDGPWPVLLPGYLFHSLKRMDSEIKAAPHVPRNTAEASFAM